MGVEHLSNQREIDSKDPVLAEWQRQSLIKYNVSYAEPVSDDKPNWFSEKPKEISGFQLTFLGARETHAVGVGEKKC